MDFVEAVFPSKIPPDVRKAFEKGRKNRHEFMYSKAGTVTLQQVENIIAKAETLLANTKQIIKM